MNKPLLLAIGPVSSESGYGRHAADVVRSIIKTDKYDVKILPIKWGNTPLNALKPGKDDDLLNRILKTPLQKQPDITVQITVPNEFMNISPIPGKFNIGITAGIESTMVNSKWLEGMNRMNINIVPSEFSKFAFLNSKYVKQHPQTRAPMGQLKLEKEIHTIFEGCDTNIYKPIDQNKIPKTILEKLNTIPEEWCYLIVGHWLPGEIGHDRKDIGMSIKVFLETFKDMDNPPALVLKSSIGTFSKISYYEMERRIKKIKSSIQYQNTLPNVYLVYGQLTDEEMNGLYNHDKIKALYTITKGEGFCVKGDTKIITENGLKEIKNINLNDRVLSHTGNFKNVTSVMNRNISEKMYNFEVYNSFSSEKTWFTGNHNILTYDISLDEYKWKSADEIKISDYLCFPRFKNDDNINYIYLYDYLNNVDNIILEDNNIKFNHSDKSDRLHYIKNKKYNLNSEFGKLIGYYLSEGCADGESVIFSLHQNEENTIGKEIIDIFDNLFDIKQYKIFKDNNSNKLKVIFYSKIISHFLINFCGKYSHGKFINDVIFRSNIKFKKSLISSLLLGDGHIKEHEINLSLVNKNIIQNLRILLFELGIISNYSFYDKDKLNDRKNYSEILHKHDVYKLNITKRESLNKLLDIINKNHSFIKFNLNEDLKYISRNKKSLYKKDYMIFKIKNINIENFNGNVYNISVENDESYCLQDFVVHNCRPLLEFSMVGKPIIASAWSGHLDFLSTKYNILLPGELKNIHSSAANEFLLKEAKWFYADYGIASKALVEVYKNYHKYKSKARKQSIENKKEFSMEKMDYQIKLFFDKYIPEFPVEVDLVMPESLKKTKKIQLPKLKKIKKD